MCTCIKDFEKKMIGRQFKNKKVVKAEMVSAALMFDGSGVKASLDIELHLEGQKKVFIQKAIASYCPFCGVKYAEVEEMKEIPES